MRPLLVVDDDEGNRLSLAMLLEEEGYTVRTAASFAEASSDIQSQAPTELIFLDQELGDGHGVDLLPAIRLCLPHTKVFLLSGERELPHNDCPVDAAFSKGGDVSELIAAVKRLGER